MSLRIDNFIALLSGSIAAWLERHAAARIEYLQAENRTLRIRLGGRRIIFTDAELECPGFSGHAFLLIQAQLLQMLPGLCHRDGCGGVRDYRTIRCNLGCR